MMKPKKKLYFFNDLFKDYPKWLYPVVTIASIIGVLVIMYLVPVDKEWLGHIIWLLYLSTISYRIFQSTRKNAFDWRRGDQFKLTIKGKKLEVDVKFLSAYYIKEEVLHIERINRLDTFPLDHLREKDIKKMLDLIELQHYNYRSK
jgi:hypothetical protein